MCACVIKKKRRIIFVKKLPRLFHDYLEDFWNSITFSMTKKKFHDFSMISMISMTSGHPAPGDDRRNIKSRKLIPLRSKGTFGTNVIMA